MTTAELAAALDVNRSTLTVWRRDGAPCRKVGRRLSWDLDEVKQWLLENRGQTTARQGRPSDAEMIKAKLAAAVGGELPSELVEALESLEAAKLEKAKWDAVKAKQQALKAEGQLMDREEVERGRVERINAVTGLMESAPAKWAVKFVGCKSERKAEGLLREMLRGMREEFSRT